MLGGCLKQIWISDVTQFGGLCCFQNSCNNSVWECWIKFIILFHYFRWCAFKFSQLSVCLVKQSGNYCSICSYVCKKPKTPQKGHETWEGFCALDGLSLKLPDHHHFTSWTYFLTARSTILPRAEQLSLHNGSHNGLGLVPRLRQCCVALLCSLLVPRVPMLVPVPCRAGWM